MRTSVAKFSGNLIRIASALASLFIGMAFVAVTGAGAAPPDKKFEFKDKEKIEKFEKKDIEDKEDSRFFNRRAFFDNDNRKAFFDNDVRFVRPFFNRGEFFDRDVFFEEEDDDD